MSPKKIIQDINPAPRRSIRNIPLEDREEVQAPPPPKTPKKGIEIRKIVEEKPEEIVKEPIIVPKTVREPGPKRRGSSFKYILSFLLVFVCIGIIALAFSLSYSKAVVTITPKIVNFDINGTFTAKKDAALGDLSYEVITVSEEEKQTLPATKGGLVETKAKGILTIYNDYSAAPQTLVAGTRLATSDGLIYRTTSTVSVPGKKSTPGSINVDVVADLPGEDYNKSSTLKEDFKIVAFKGTERYEGFYARLKTDISGGYKGNKMVVDENSKNETVKALKDSVKTKLLSKIKSTVPADYVVYNPELNIEYETPEPSMKDDSSAELLVRATAYVPIFKSDSLIKYIAGSEIKKFPSELYRIDNEENLIFNISNSKDFSAKKGTPLIFTLKGPISIVGTFDESKLKDELKSVSLAESNAIFAKYPAISNAYALITPFWMRSFPKTTDKIIIEYK
jgi:hypothetical protein